MPARQMPGERYRYIEHLAREPRAVEACAWTIGKVYGNVGK
jgi:hypothetical protein